MIVNCNGVGLLGIPYAIFDSLSLFNTSVEDLAPRISKKKKKNRFHFILLSQRLTKCHACERPVKWEDIHNDLNAQETCSFGAGHMKGNVISYNICWKTS